MKHYRLPLTQADKAALYALAKSIGVSSPTALLRGVVRSGGLMPWHITAAQAADREAHAALSTRKKKDTGE